MTFSETFSALLALVRGISRNSMYGALEWIVILSLRLSRLQKPSAYERWIAGNNILRIWICIRSISLLKLEGRCARHHKNRCNYAKEYCNFVITHHISIYSKHHSVKSLGGLTTNNLHMLYAAGSTAPDCVDVDIYDILHKHVSIKYARLSSGGKRRMLVSL